MTRSRLTHAGFRVCATALLLIGLPLIGLRVLGRSSTAEDSKMIQPKHTNHLINSSSPYLLQHAHNPVDWYPWGREALDKAKREKKPIFLSIGYSACHWCHVMERESFENGEIARILNEHFVCIKVDREEWPDLDEIYMTAVQLMAGSGGWPMSVFLTPDLKPFYGGTYFPPEDRWGRPGFKRILTQLAATYRERPEDIEKSTKEIVSAMKRAAVDATDGAGVPAQGLIQKAVSQLRSRFDDGWGGFGSAPKFPSPGSISLLLRYHRRTGDTEALRMATVTLDRMAYGGMYDQLGGGFHRYSVDREWLVPHFEKMLYDNAQLAIVYLDAFLVTNKPLYRRIAKETLDYVLHEMTDESGGFHSTLDADSEGEEGKYYVWDVDEIGSVLPSEDAGLFSEYHGVTKRGNFEGHNILHAPLPPEEFAERKGLETDAWLERLDAMRPKLLELRAKRVSPGKDDKILTDWNGLMISALARGYQVLGDEAYRQAAERAADFILTEMRSDDGLLHAHRRGRSHISGYLDDYAFFTLSLLDLYQATFDIRWIENAKQLADTMAARFWDGEGGLFFVAADQPDVIIRTKGAQDNATPAGNSVAAQALFTLAKLTQDDGHLARAERTLSAFGGSAQRFPSAFARLLCAADLYHGPTRKIAIVGRAGVKPTAALLQSVWRRYLPNTVVAMFDPSSPNAAEIAEAVPLLASRPTVKGSSTVYVCRDFVCERPVTTAAELDSLLVN